MSDPISSARARLKGSGKGSFASMGTTAASSISGIVWRNTLIARRLALVGHAYNG